jgi:hypothetical protein
MKAALSLTNQTNKVIKNLSFKGKKYIMMMSPLKKKLMINQKANFNNKINILKNYQKLLISQLHWLEVKNIILGQVKFYITHLFSQVLQTVQLKTPTHLTMDQQQRQILFQIK